MPTTTTTTTATCFSAAVFGPKLAANLDALHTVQQKNSEHFALAPLPFLGLFTVPVGDLWYEADMLTRHYHALDISL